jgi:hypothetical protein
MQTSRLAACALTLITIVACSAIADDEIRPDGTNRSWFGHIDGGYAFAINHSGDFLDDDWTATGAVIRWPTTWPAGHSLALNDPCLNRSASAIGSINRATSQDPDNEGAMTSRDYGLPEKLSPSSSRRFDQRFWFGWCSGGPVAEGSDGSFVAQAPQNIGSTIKIAGAMRLDFDDQLPSS